MKTKSSRGFTLIELVLVVAVVAILSVIAIGKFSDLRKESARRVNVANIKNITRTIATEQARVEGETFYGMFAYAESLIDSVPGGGDVRGSEGSYEWRSAWYDGAGGVVPGIYCGIKKATAVANAEGVTTGEVAPIASAHEQNTGLAGPRDAAFAAKLGMYYLTAKEVTSLYEAGVSVVSRHNFSSAQATTLNWTTSKYYTELGLHATGGGPGMRADLSACYPVVLTNGSAVAVLNPASCESIYRDLGLEYKSTYNVAGLDANQPETYFAKGICVRLVAVGLGRDCVATTKFFENAPRCPVLPQTRYRNYILLFSMNNGTGNSGTTVKFVGVIDPSGNTAKQAQYNSDWSA